MRLTENVEHLFFRCLFGKEVCSHFFIDVGFDPENMTSVIKWVNAFEEGAASSHHAREILSLVAWVCWGIWKSRNLLLFENCVITSDRVVDQIKGWFSEFSLLKEPR